MRLNIKITFKSSKIITQSHNTIKNYFIYSQNVYQRVVRINLNRKASHCLLFINQKLIKEIMIEYNY
jgi:hypothetical protein